MEQTTNSNPILDVYKTTMCKFCTKNNICNKDISLFKVKVYNDRKSYYCINYEQRKN